MSVTFIPAAGTWTSYHYYNHSGTIPAVDHCNGVERIADEHPSLNVSQFNYREVLELLGLPKSEDDCVGRLPAATIPVAIRVVVLARQIELNISGEAPEYSSELLDLLLHCRYHNCDLTWA